MNLDFADIKTVLTGAGMAIMGMGEAAQIIEAADNNAQVILGHVIDESLGG